MTTHAPDLQETLLEARREVDRLNAEIARLREVISGVDQRIATARAQGREAGIQGERDRLRTMLIEEGERRDWCDELDDFLIQCGMEPRTREFDVEVTFTFTQTVTVTARDAESAQQMIEDDINTSQRIDPFGSLSPDASMVDLEYTIDDVSESE